MDVNHEDFTEEQPTPRLRDLTGEELQARLRERTAAARERAGTKVTAEDILARRQRRRQARKEKPRRRIRIDLGVGIALLVVAGVAVAGASASSQETEQVSVKNQHRITALSQQLSEIQASQGEQARVTLSEDAVAELAAIKTKGAEVAALQNAYHGMLSGIDPTGQRAGAKASAGYAKSLEQRRLIAEYFVPETYLIEGETAYAADTVIDLGPNSIDPRMPWYQRRSDAAAPVWTLATVTPESEIDGDADVERLTDVVWLCQDADTGDLLAWANAKYSMRDDAFASLRVGTTSLGDEQSAAHEWNESTGGDL